VTTFSENLDMLGNLMAVRECWGVVIIKKSYRRKLFIVDAYWCTISIVLSMVHFLAQFIALFCSVLFYYCYCLVCYRNCNIVSSKESYII